MSISAIRRPLAKQQAPARRYNSALEACLIAQNGTEPRGRGATFFGISPLSPAARLEYAAAEDEVRATRMNAGYHATDTYRYLARFERLHMQVEEASHRSRLWASTGILATLLVLTAALVNVFPML